MILGTALIVLTWTLFTGMGLPLWAGIIFTVIGSFIFLFGLTFGIYMFNLDMKMTSMLFPLFQKHYDKMKRDQHL